jgi:hypothetical protein
MIDYIVKEDTMHKGIPAQQLRIRIEAVTERVRKDEYELKMLNSLVPKQYIDHNMHNPKTLEKMHCMGRKKTLEVWIKHLIKLYGLEI